MFPEHHQKTPWSCSQGPLDLRASAHDFVEIWGLDVCMQHEPHTTDSMLKRSHHMQSNFCCIPIGVCVLCTAGTMLDGAGAVIATIQVETGVGQTRGHLQAGLCTRAPPSTSLTISLVLLGLLVSTHLWAPAKQQISLHIPGGALKSQQKRIRMSPHMDAGVSPVQTCSHSRNSLEWIDPEPSAQRRRTVTTARQTPHELLSILW